MCQFDYPYRWKTLLSNDIMNALNSENEKGILTGLQVLVFLTKKYEFETEEDREPLYAIMQQSLDIIGAIIDQFMN